MQGGVVVATTSFSGVFSTAETRAWMHINPSLSVISDGILRVDLDADGRIETMLRASLDRSVSGERIPPEMRLFFDPDTKELSVLGIDEHSYAVAYIGDTEILVVEGAGNRLQVPLLSYERTNQHTLVSFASLLYNGKQFPIATTTVSYRVFTDRNDGYRTVVSSVQVGKENVELRYHSNKNETAVTERAVSRDTSHFKGNGKTYLRGLVTPFVETKEGKVIIGY